MLDSLSQTDAQSAFNHTQFGSQMASNYDLHPLWLLLHLYLKRFFHPNRQSFWTPFNKYPHGLPMSSFIYISSSLRWFQWSRSYWVLFVLALVSRVVLYRRQLVLKTVRIESCSKRCHIDCIRTIAVASKSTLSWTVSIPIDYSVPSPVTRAGTETVKQLGRQFHPENS